MKLLVQLNFGGNCKQAFEFYQEHLGGKITMMVDHSSMPAPNKPPPGIIHARMDLGETVLIGNDVAPERHQPMRSAYLYLSVDTPDEAERVHALLAEGGEVFLPMGEPFFARRFSMLRDKFGVSWSIICERPM